MLFHCNTEFLNNMTALADTLLATRGLVVIFISFCDAERGTCICFVPIRLNFAGLPGPDFTLKVMMKRLRNRHFYVLGNKI